MHAKNELSLQGREPSGVNTALLPSRLCIGLSTCSATSCAATALPSCLPPSGNRAASTWRLRSSSADVSEDAFLVAPPELVCLCSNSLKRERERERARVGFRIRLVLRLRVWPTGGPSRSQLEPPGGAGVGREAAPLEHLIRGVSCREAQVVNPLLVVANAKSSA